MSSLPAKLVRFAIVPVAALLCNAAAVAHDGAHAELLLRPGKLPDVELPAQAQRGTGISGDFNPHALNAFWLKFTLSDGRELHAFRKRQGNDQRQGESWVGEFENAPGSLLVLTRYRGVVTGFLHHGPDVYELAPRSGGRQILYKVDPAKIPQHARPLRAPTAGTTTGGTDYGTGTSATTATSGIVQDLLVVYTAKAVTAAGDETKLQSQISTAVSAANAAYANSQLGLSLNLVGMALTTYTETGDMGQALSALQSKSDGKMDEVHTLRDQLGADLVALVNEDSNYCGIAYVMNSVGSGFAPYAFSVTWRGCLSNQTLAHEIGHNQGNHHDRETAGTGTGAYPYSYGLRRCATDGTGFRTVMAYSCTGGNRVNYFSNPAISVNGYPTGISYETDSDNSADNARSMGNTASAIAAFRAGAVASPPAAPGALTGTTLGSNSVRLNWSDTADESGFEVWRSPSGVEGTFVLAASLGSNATSWTDNTLQPLTPYWWRVRAFNAAGSSAFSNTASATTADLPPAAPVSASAVYESATASVAISWTDSSANETAFEIRRETYNSRKGTWGSAVAVGSVAANVTQFRDAASAGTYRYTVRAVNAGGASTWSPYSGNVVVAGSTTKGRK
jgi:hypothetical protein